MKTGYVIFAAAVLFTACLGNVYSSEYSHAYIGQSTASSSPTSNGTAAAIAASQHSFAYGITSLQGSLAVGAFEDQTAISFGLAKRFKKSLINGSISSENGKVGLGAAVKFHF